jgi:hypothetical protein
MAMEPLDLEAKAKTPDIHFDANSGVMEIKGMSCSENSLEFYKPIVAWAEAYAAEPRDKTVVNMNFKYFNTASAKCILEVLEKFVVANRHGSEITFNWIYEANDDQMLEAGEYFSEIINHEINLIGVEHTN